jgi:hypothetical protein
MNTFLNNLKTQAQQKPFLALVVGAYVLSKIKGKPGFALRIEVLPKKKPVDK